MKLWPWYTSLARRKALERERASLLEIIQNRKMAQMRQRLYAGGGIGIVLILGLTLWGVPTTQSRSTSGNRCFACSLASDLHDDVGALLGSILLTGNRLKTEAVDERQHEHATRLIHSTSKAIQGLRDIVWITNQDQDSMRHLVTKIQEVLNQYREDYVVSLETDPAIQNSASVLGLSIKRDVFLIVKEALHNVHKHAGASRISVSIRHQRGNLVIRIVDNGSGFDAHKAMEDLEFRVRTAKHARSGEPLGRQPGYRARTGKRHNGHTQVSDETRFNTECRSGKWLNKWMLNSKTSQSGS